MKLNTRWLKYFENWSKTKEVLFNFNGALCYMLTKSTNLISVGKFYIKIYHCEWTRYIIRVSMFLADWIVSYLCVENLNTENLAWVGFIYLGFNIASILYRSYHNRWFYGQRKPVCTFGQGSVL